MRDIIFRGKRADNGEWVTGFYCTKDGAHFITTIGMYKSGKNYFSDVLVNPETIGQYTGTIDKNGKKIFEGDIVRTEFGRLCIFEWFENRVTRCWDLSPILTNSNLIHPAPYRTSIFDSEHLEVVGNIHDNPELLEEKT